MAVLAILGSMSLGVFVSLPARFATQGMAASIRALLRRARAAAIESRADAQVSFERGRVEARAWTTLAFLRFEALLDGPKGEKVTQGSRGLVARVTGATWDKGRIGNALFFEEGGAHVDCGDLPIFSPRDGVKIEAWVYPGDFAQVRTPADGDHRARPPAPGLRHEDLYLFEVVGKGDGYFLRIREDYAIVAGVRGLESSKPVVRSTPPGVLSPERWAEVAMVFDGEDLRILVNGLRRNLPPGEEENAAKLPKALLVDRAPLCVSNAFPGLSFFGGIDEVRVSGIASEESIELGGDVAVEAPAAVRFDSRGELDGLYHSGPVHIAVRRVASDGAGPKALTMTAEAITVERSGALR